MPTIAEAMQLAVQHYRAGNVAQAHQIFQQVLQVDPANADAWHLLGQLASQMGQQQAALEYIHRAVELNPTQADFAASLAVVYQALKQWDKSAACSQQALRIRPDFPVALNNLGIALRNLGLPDEALPAFKRAIDLQPAFPEALNNLGNLLMDMGLLGEAQEVFRRAIQLRATYPEAHNNLGSVLWRQGQIKEAIACFRRAVEIRPAFVEASNNLALSLQDSGGLDEAIAIFGRVVEARPDQAEAHNNLGLALWKKKKYAEAGAAIRRALDLQPNSAPFFNSLGNILKDEGKLDEAVTAYRRALQFRPDFAPASHNLGNVLKDMGMLDEALASFRRALELRPDSIATHSNVVYTLHFHPDADAGMLREEHRRWNERHAAPLANRRPPYANDRDPDRPLRVGYVSADYRNHPVGRFLLPLLEAHDPRNVEVHCYASVTAPDDLTPLFHKASDHWDDVARLSDVQLADLVYHDQIDILVDLTAHMSDHRLLVFARKPAPVQVTYLAYCSSTGLNAIDYRITDPFLDPPGDDRKEARGEEQGYYTEESVWLPETYWCYRPFLEIAPAGPPPALKAGHVTFGCLNNFCKVTQPTLAAWRDLLQMVRNSRLLLHARPGAHRDRVLAFFGAANISLGRIEFVDMLPGPEYHRIHKRIDICLDPFPYTGGTTTCDALWMGVPVISMAGKLAIARSGLSILSNIGLPELVGHSVEEYVQITASLAGDLPRLTTLRKELRQRLQQSPLMDEPRFAAHVEAAYRTMWRRWCALANVRVEPEV